MKESRLNFFDVDNSVFESLFLKMKDSKGRLQTKSAEKLFAGWASGVETVYYRSFCIYSGFIYNTFFKNDFQGFYRVTSDWCLIWKLVEKREVGKKDRKNKTGE